MLGLIQLLKSNPEIEFVLFNDAKEWSVIPSNAHPHKVHRDEILDLEDNYASQSKEKISSNEENENLNAENKLLLEQVEQLEKEKAEFQEENEKLSKEVARLSQQVTDSEKKISELAASLLKSEKAASKAAKTETPS